MRQLKGKVKESRKEKRERKRDNAQNKENFFKIVVPTLVLAAAGIVAYVLYHTRSGAERVGAAWEDRLDEFD